ncbi:MULTISPECIES: hypothetical protein [Mesorhizobium]|uniref:Uncharacterized protein n=2 Tax=Mesorhizobium TaxID=68287 RepID=G6Y2Y4_9HYPH|nr:MULTISPECIES: hypothetical protein [Mesorhizobium]ANT54487.1 hypothetical protein A6B35_31095 [Mesorhizobium amorphae CCNWGS0123]EHH13900.1 hypothetical protein MEA186_01186 [Mesorhizobium amorphae CCNWGS0123]MCV3211564.1 hypothetical protein [Mesorhizobium sp. YC-2]MCV3233238.1 hypothetical protein [Mesorhizobium sp. YC-39]MCV3243836.1 hypothetical protein [Mesorhizobium sp. ZC-5]
MDCFKKIEGLIDAAGADADTAGADAIDDARDLLGQFKDKSETIAHAIDDFLLDLMTLLFVVEATRERFHNPARRLARTRLSRIRLLLTR